MTFARGLLTSVIALSLAAPAMALEAAKQIEVKATPAATWAAIGDFCGIGNWHPAVSQMRAVGEGWRQDFAPYRSMAGARSSRS